LSAIAELAELGDLAVPAVKTITQSFE